MKLIPCIVFGVALLAGCADPNRYQGGTAEAIRSAKVDCVMQDYRARHGRSDDAANMLGGAVGGALGGALAGALVAASTPSQPAETPDQALDRCMIARGYTISQR
jgi:hypothetical protein